MTIIIYFLQEMWREAKLLSTDTRCSRRRKRYRDYQLPTLATYPCHLVNATRDPADCCSTKSGYRNRLLPLPIPHRQPYPDDEPDPVNPFDREPLWTQLVPQSRTAQYILHWYAAETLSEADEASIPRSPTPPVPTVPGERQLTRKYHPPPPFPVDLTLKERVAQDARGGGGVYEPKKHLGTGVDSEEAFYESRLLSIADAREKLKGSVQADVVRRGWEAIKLRMRIEEEEGEEGAEEAKDGKRNRLVGVFV